MAKQVQKELEDKLGPRGIIIESVLLRDIQLPAMLHAALVRSPVAHGLLRGIDARAALALEGVQCVLTASDLKEMLQVEATSAEMAARRLVNLVNINGATDNATVVVIRAT